jgi:hypothetical protein
MFFADRSTSMKTSPRNGHGAPAVAGDELADLWDAWRSAAAAARLALSGWSTAATAEDRAACHAGYRAAVEREEHVARLLSQRLGRVPVGE